MSSLLILGTSTWPFDGAREESFLAPEIEHTAQRFDRVVVMPQRKLGARRPLLKGVEIDLSLADRATGGGLRSLVEGVAAVIREPLLVNEVVQTTMDFPSTLAQRLVLNMAAASMRARRAISSVVARSGVLPADAVAYSYWCDAWALGAVLAAVARPGLEVVTRMHGYDLFAERHVPAFIPYQRFILERASRLFLVSDAAKGYLASKFPDLSHKTSVFRLGVRAQDGRSARSDDGRCRVVSCSEVIPLKRVDLLLEGLCELARRHRAESFEWLHIGGGVGLEVLRGRAASAPPNLSIRLAGEIENAEVVGAYLAKPVDLFAHVSSSEGGVPVALQEAASVGIPLLGTAVGGVPEIVSNETGRLLSATPSAGEIADACWGLFGDKVALARCAERSYQAWRVDFDAARNHGRFAQTLRRSPNENEVH
jgi:colanic acid/amylovoran biosynthesis glycosyltransferase